jgi:hypothetical protein
MGDLFIRHPEAALIPAGVFLGFRWFARSTGAMVAGCAWLLYAVLEILNQLRITCSGECNIRIDLLLIYPILVLFSGWALAAMLGYLWTRVRRTNE